MKHIANAWLLVAVLVTGAVLAGCDSGGTHLTKEQASQHQNKKDAMDSGNGAGK